MNRHAKRLLSGATFWGILCVVAVFAYWFTEFARMIAIGVLLSVVVGVVCYGTGFVLTGERT